VSGSEETVWVSGDYSAATDKIDIRLTRAAQRVCESVLRRKWKGDPGLLEQYLVCMKACIDPHFVTYSEHYLELAKEQQVLGKLLSADEKSLFDDLNKRFRNYGFQDARGQAWLRRQVRVDDDCEERVVTEWLRIPDEPRVLRFSEFQQLGELKPKRASGLLDATLQQNGQLMGSPLSFPILCLVNFCCAWIALFPTAKLHEVPVLVNGDDILFRTLRSSVPQWYDAIANCGFEKSVGKNFVHRQAIFINSEPWIASRRSDFSESALAEFERMPFFNVGLLHGQSKVASSPQVVGGTSFQPLWALQPEAVAGARDRERAVKRFNSIHREALNRASASGFFSHALPPQYLGLGMVPCEKTVYTFTQRCIATSIWREARETILSYDPTVPRFITERERRMPYRPQTIISNTLSPLHDLQNEFVVSGYTRGEVICPQRSAGSSRRGYTVMLPKDRMTRSMKKYVKKLKTTDMFEDVTEFLQDAMGSEGYMFSTALFCKIQLERLLRSEPSRLRPMPVEWCLHGFSRGRDSDFWIREEAELDRLRGMTRATRVGIVQDAPTGF